MLLCLSENALPAPSIRHSAKSTNGNRSLLRSVGDRRQVRRCPPPAADRQARIHRDQDATAVSRSPSTQNRRQPSAHQMCRRDRQPARTGCPYTLFPETGWLGDSHSICCINVMLHASAQAGVGQRQLVRKQARALAQTVTQALGSTDSRLRTAPAQRPFDVRQAAPPRRRAGIGAPTPPGCNAPACSQIRRRRPTRARAGRHARRHARAGRFAISRRCVRRLPAHRNAAQSDHVLTSQRTPSPPGAPGRSLARLRCSRRVS